MLSCARERKELKCLLLLCAGRRREEGGFLVHYALEEGSEMECFFLYAFQEGITGAACCLAIEEGSEMECLVLLCVGRRREEE